MCSAASAASSLPRPAQSETADMHTPLTKADVAYLADRMRRYGRWRFIRQSEQLDLALAADTLLTLAEYCSVKWPIVIERRKE